MRRTIIVVTLALAGALLVAPAVLSWTGAARMPTFEQRVPADWPATPDPLDAGWTAEVGAAVTDRLAGQALGARALGAFDFRVTDRAPTDRVLVGAGDILYVRSSMAVPCLAARPVTSERSSLRALEAATRQADLRLVALVVPDKAASLPDDLPAEFLAKGRCLHARAAAAEEMMTEELGSDAISVLDGLSTPGTYFDEDTHWSPAGRQVGQQRLVEALVPGMWTDDAVVALPGSRGLDLRGMMGMPKTIDTQDHELAFAGSTEIRDLDLGTDIPVVTTHSEPAPGRQLVPGRTLVVHDSFVNGWREDFMGLFADATFVHWSSLEAPGVTDVLAGHDTIVVETVGRYFWGIQGDEARFVQLAEALRRAEGG